MTQSRNGSIIHDSFLLQLLQEHADIGTNLGRIGFAEFILQLGNDFPEGALAIASFEHLPTCSLQFDCAFRKQDHAVLFCAAPAASRSEAGTAGVSGRWHGALPLHNPRSLHYARMRSLRSG